MLSHKPRLLVLSNVVVLLTCVHLHPVVRVAVGGFTWISLGVFLLRVGTLLTVCAARAPDQDKQTYFTSQKVTTSYTSVNVELDQCEDQSTIEQLEDLFTSPYKSNHYNWTRWGEPGQSRQLKHH